MSLAEIPRVAYVLKRYPRYSETFVVNEILAHERAGLNIEIFALRPPIDTHFQDAISRVKASVTYLPCNGVKALDFWLGLEQARALVPNFFPRLEGALGEQPIDVFQAAVLAREIVMRRITHLHAHFATSATSVARLAARFAGITYTFTAHAKDIFHESVSQEDVRRKMVEAKATVTISEFNLSFLRETYGSAAARVERIYNGLELGQLRYESPGPRRRQIVSVGRLVEKKGFNILIDACAALKAHNVDFSCTIVGTGPLEAELRSQIADLDLNATVQLIGPRPQQEVFELVQTASVFAAPCLIAEDGNRDGLPTVLLEAMALGTPCISTDVTGIPEIVIDRKTGLIVKQHDVGGLASALEQLLMSPTRRQELARSARLLIEKEFDVEVNAARQRELFLEHKKPERLQEVA